MNVPLINSRDILNSTKSTMNQPDQFKNPYEIEEISDKIQKFLRDHSQFIERVSSLSEFFSEYDSFIQYLKENQIIFQILDIDKKIFSDLVTSKMIPVVLKDCLETSRELSYKRIRRLEKFDEALSQSRNLIQEKIQLEKNFEIS